PMASVRIATLGPLYWPNWRHRGASGAEVYIEHVDADADKARELARALEARGLWVEIRADVDEARAARLVRKAEVVVVLDAAELEPIEQELGEQIRCGERSVHSASVVPADIDPEWVLELARRAPSLLPMNEVRACREPLNLPVEIDGCDQR